MSLRNINLNLLPMLQALLREQSVSAAADSLGLTQPAVSAALARLRVALDDPLLIKVGRRMELTSRARQLMLSVDQACEAMERVWGNPPFDPLTHQRTFVIASADHGPLILAPPLLQRLAVEAPRVAIHFIDFSPDHLHKTMDRRVEFMMAPSSVFNELNHDELRLAQLTPSEDFVAVIGPEHRLARQARLSQADLAQERHVIFHPGPTRTQELTEIVSGHAPSQFVAARFQQFTILPIVASLSDTVAIVPRRVAEQLSRVLTIRIVESNGVPLHTDLVLAWSPVYDADPAHVWLRSMILEIHR